MVDFSSTSIPKPKNWQDFERGCRILFECILGDPLTQCNGISGQRQNGVDVFGRRGSVDNHWVGVQCKGKEGGYGKNVTEKELKKEVQKARAFKPSLSEFILVTTAPDDVKIQEVARIITEENQKSGNPLPVAVWGWGTLESRISENQRAIRAFHPDAFLFSDEILVGVARIGENQTRNSQLLDQLLLVQNKGLVTDATDSFNSVNDAVDKHLHDEIDRYRDLIQTNKPSTAIDLLEKLKERVWQTASHRIRFRITTNIGAAWLKLGKNTNAANNFLAAIQLQPTDKIGMANVSLAYLLLDDTVSAVVAAQEALAQDRTNENAAAYLIHAYINDFSIQNPFTLIPENLHNIAPVRAAVIFFYRRREQTIWHDEAHKAVVLFPDSDDLRRVVAEAELDSVFENKAVLLGQQLKNGFDLEKFQTAVSVLHEIWDKLKNTEVIATECSLPQNLVQAYRFLGQPEEAAKIADEALRKLPDDHDLIKLRAVLYLVANSDNDAARILSGKEDDPEIALMLAEIKLKNDPQAARELLSQIDKAKVGEQNQLTARLIHIETHLKENNLDEATKEAQDLATIYPRNIKVLCQLAHVQMLVGDTTVNQTLTQAKEQLNDFSSFFDRFILAETMAATSHYEDVVDILHGQVDCSRDTPALRLFLSALIDSDRRSLAHDLIEVLSEKILDDPFYLQAQAALHINRGDLPAAAEALRRYLQIKPGDLYMRTRWVNVHLHQGNEAVVKEFLNTQVEKLYGDDPKDLMYLARLLDYFGFYERAISLAYEIFLKKHNDPQIHLSYIMLLLFTGHFEDLDLVNNQVGIDTVFVIVNNRGEQETWLVEPNEQLRILDEAIAPDHLMAQKAFGLRIGDSFVIDETKISREEWRVVSIKHKYLAALHDAMERYERRFPTDGGLERFIVDANSSEPLEPILKRTKESHDNIQSILKQYDQKRLPLSLVAHCLERNIITTWAGLAESGYKFHVCIGTEVERRAALEAIHYNDIKGCVVDTLTIYLIRWLGVEDTIVKVCGPIGIAQSSIDELRYRRNELALHSGHSLMTIYWKDGQYFRNQISPEYIQNALNVMDKDITWINQNCEVIPAQAPNDLSSELRRISKKLNRVFFDPILAADGSRRILLCEDYGYRNIGNQYLGLKSTWIQPVLMDARERNLIAREKYNEIIIKMILAGHRYVSIDAGVLAAVAAKSEEDSGVRFSRVAETLGGADAEITSHIRVAAEFLNMIWQNSNPPLNRVAQTSKLIDCLMKRSDWLLVIKLLDRMMPSSAFKNHLFRWLQGHFFIPFQ